MKQTNAVDRFNPKNATSLKEEDHKDLQELTVEEIQELAKAYPNQPNGNNYLVLEDTSVKDPTKQLYPLSTWANLAELHKVGQKQYRPVGFRATFKGGPTAQAAKPGRAQVQDLTKEDLNKEEGLNKTTIQNQGVQNQGGEGEGSGSQNEAGQGVLTKAELEGLSADELKEKYEAATGKKAGRTSKANMIKELVKLSKG